MNTSRLILTISALIASTSVFAGTATIAAVKGRAGPVSGGDIVPGVAGQTLNEGTVIETDAKSTLKLRLSNGGSLVLGPLTRIILRFNNDILIATLVRGTISGDFKAGSTVRTSAGVATFSGGPGAVQFANGVMATAPTAGTASVKPAGSPTAMSVPGGNIIFTPAGTTKPGVLTPDQVASVQTGAMPPPSLFPADAATTPDRRPIDSVPIVASQPYNPILISPNGE